MQHVRLALRMLRKTPFVTAVAIASLALGIGANAAIYSLFDQFLIRQLPVRAPAELVNLSAPGPKPGSTNCSQAGSCEDVFSYAMFRDLEQQQTSLAGVAGHVSFGANLSVREEAFTGRGMFVSGGYFGTLGITPALGRLLQPADDAVIGANYVTVLAHEFWLERFGGDPKVLGQTIIVNGKSLTIIGVAPQGFRGTTLGAEPLLYVPLSMRAAVSTWRPAFEDRRNYWVYVFGRLKPGSSIEQASAGLNTLYKNILVDVEAPLQQGMSDATMQRFKTKAIAVSAGARGQSSIHREAKTPLIMLFAITGTVLLIACANIANLLLARGASRATEMGVRLALGATRAQLLRQLLTESLVLAVLGGLVSLLVAIWTLQGVASFMPPEALETMDISLRPQIIAFAGLLAVATGIVFGLFPALHSTRSDLISVIRAGAGQITGGGRAASRFRTALVTVQIALSVALLISAGLFLKSLVNVSRTDLGLSVDQVATFAISPMRSGYDSTRAKVLYDRLEQELRGLPGVTDVTSARVAVLAGNNWGNDVRVQGFTCLPDTDCNARYNGTGSDYLKTLGMTLLAGRDFTESDRLGSAKVALVNETFARKFNLGPNPVGKFMARAGPSGQDSLDMQIVGLVKDAKYSDVKDSVPPLFYTPWRQDGSVSALNFYVRTTLPPAEILRGITATMRRLDATVPVEELKTLPQQVKENVFLDRMISTLAASFAVLATLLAAVGLYGMLAYTVTQRTREIGVRMALGADAAKVRALVMRQVGGMTALGTVVGVAAALALGRAARSQLYQLEGHDPVVFVLAVVLLVSVALAAGFLPARRAAQVDPMQALRYD
ncbi:MAG: ABC transporter permease [Gemmatimonadetes bacterium]|nr:ABC transporter permease [Gemmatimonadota bacterium]